MTRNDPSSTTGVIPFILFYERERMCVFAAPSAM